VECEVRNNNFSKNINKLSLIYVVCTVWTINQNCACTGYIVPPWTDIKIYFLNFFKKREDSLAARIVLKTTVKFECNDAYITEIYIYIWYKTICTHYCLFHL